MFAVLRQRNFTLLWVGGLISSIGSSMLYIALPFYVYERTNSALASGAIFITQMLPGLLLGSVAGVFVDRWDRRRTMVVADAARAALILLLFAVRSSDWLWVVYMVAFLEQAASLFFGPANSALVPRLVGDEHLIAANSLRTISFNITRLVGPALGGTLMALLGLPALVLLDSLSYVISGVLILLIVVPPVAAPAERLHPTAVPWTAFWREWLEGLRLVQSNRALVALFAVTGIAMFADSFLLVLLIPFVRDVLQGDVLDFGWMQMAIGAGGLAGGVVVGYLGRVVLASRLLATAIGAVGIITLLLANSHSFPLILALLAVLGVPVTVWLVAQQTLLQSMVADRYRGRVFGSHGTMTTLLMLGGMGLGGALAAPLGIVPMLDVAAGLYILAMLMGLVLLRERAVETSSEQHPRPLQLQAVEAALTEQLFAFVNTRRALRDAPDLVPEMDAVLESMALDGVNQEEDVAAYVQAILQPIGGQHSEV
jgi:MFS family permease